MQIQLKQAEIESAIKQYIACQGIALDSKYVAISFTSGRKGTGLSADIDITNTVYSYTDSEQFVIDEPFNLAEEASVIVDSDINTAVVNTPPIPTPEVSFFS